MMLVFVKTPNDGQQELTFLAIKVWQHSGTQLGPPKGQNLSNVVSAEKNAQTCNIGTLHIGTTLHKCTAQRAQAPLDRKQLVSPQGQRSLVLEKTEI